MVLQAAGAGASVAGVIWGHFSVYHVSPKFKVCTICPAFKKFDHCLNEIGRKRCSSSICCSAGFIWLLVLLMEAELLPKRYMLYLARDGK